MHVLVTGGTGFIDTVREGNIAHPARTIAKLMEAQRGEPMGQGAGPQEPG